MEFTSLTEILQRYRIYWGACCILLFLNLIFYVAFIGRQQTKIDELQGLYVKKRMAGVIERDDKSWQYEAIQKALQSFREELPATSTFADRVTELNIVIRKHGLSVSRMIFKPARVDNLNLWKYTTSFTVSGKYARLKSLLSNIQNLPGLFCIESLAFKKRSKDQDLVDMSLTITTYLR